MTHKLPIVLATAALATQAAGQQLEVDKAIPSYEKTGEFLHGDLNAVGSDTMINLMALWGEKFRSYHPAVRIQVEGKGSSTAPPALIEGTAQLGPMSRDMKSKEVDDFVKRFGYPPTRVRTCMDALAVFVHRDNPLEGLTLQQVDAIFSKTRKQGAAEDIRSWGQLGLAGPWAEAALSLYGRNSASGTYGFFKEKALSKGDYKDTVKEQPGSASVVQSISSDPLAIGYSGIGYLTTGVRAVPLGKEPGELYEANLENVIGGTYPLGRFLILYLNVPPSGELDALRREFLSFILSREGQEVAIKAGYLPMPASVVRKEREALGLPVPLPLNG